MTVKIPKIVLPGQPIVPILSGPKSKYMTGPNTRIESLAINGSNVPCILSNIVGKVEVTKVVKKEVEQDEQDEKMEEEEEQLNGTKDDKDEYLVEVVGKNDPKFNSSNSELIDTTKLAVNTPSQNDVILGRITKITTTRAYIEILNIDNSTTDSENNATNNSIMMTNLIASEDGENFKGIIRSQDIRSTDRDKVKVGDCFRPGDIVRAQIISLGDGINYYLTTARNDLGVVFAKSVSGKLMYALDWETMVVPESGEVQKRKCAKPF